MQLVSPCSSVFSVLKPFALGRPRLPTQRTRRAQRSRRKAKKWERKAKRADLYGGGLHRGDDARRHHRAHHERAANRQWRAELQLAPQRKENANWENGSFQRKPRSRCRKLAARTPPFPEPKDVRSYFPPWRKPRAGPRHAQFPAWPFRACSYRSYSCRSRENLERHFAARGNPNSWTQTRKRDRMPLRRQIPPLAATQPSLQICAAPSC